MYIIIKCPIYFTNIQNSRYMYIDLRVFRFKQENFDIEELFNKSIVSIKLSSRVRKRKKRYVSLQYELQVVCSKVFFFFLFLALITFAHYEAITILKNTNNRLFYLFRTPWLRVHCNSKKWLLIISRERKVATVRSPFLTAISGHSLRNAIQ